MHRTTTRQRNQTRTSAGERLGASQPAGALERLSLCIATLSAICPLSAFSLAASSFCFFCWQCRRNQTAGREWRTEEQREWASPLRRYSDSLCRACPLCSTWKAMSSSDRSLSAFLAAFSGFNLPPAHRHADHSEANEQPGQSAMCTESTRSSVFDRARVNDVRRVGTLIRPIAVADSTPAAAVRVRMRRATCGRAPAGGRSSHRDGGPIILRCAAPHIRIAPLIVSCLLAFQPTSRRGAADRDGWSASSPARFVADGSGSDRCTPRARRQHVWLSLSHAPCLPDMAMSGSTDEWRREREREKGEKKQREKKKNQPNESNGHSDLAHQPHVPSAFEWCAAMSAAVPPIPIDEQSQHARTHAQRGERSRGEAEENAQRLGCDAWARDDDLCVWCVQISLPLCMHRHSSRTQIRLTTSCRPCLA